METLLKGLWQMICSLYRMIDFIVLSLYQGGKYFINEIPEHTATVVIEILLAIKFVQWIRKIVTKTNTTRPELDRILTEQTEEYVDHNVVIIIVLVVVVIILFSVLYLQSKTA